MHTQYRSVVPAPAANIEITHGWRSLYTYMYVEKTKAETKNERAASDVITSYDSISIFSIVEFPLFGCTLYMYAQVNSS